MHILDRPIDTLPKIGPKMRERLEKLEIRTLGDLVFHFPHRYDDFSQVKTIDQLQDGETATIKVSLMSLKPIYTKTGKKLTKGVIADHTGMLDITWFNQPYTVNSLEVGEYYYVSGKPSLYKNKMSMINPVFEKSGGNNLNTARLAPIYPETVGISSKWLRQQIDKVFKLYPEIPDYLPQELLQEYELLSLHQALNNFHFPENEEQTSSARKRFAFEEFFLEMLQVEHRRKRWEQKSTGPNIEQKTIKNLNVLEQTLPFTLTESQQNAIKEISEEMAQAHPMNRLLEGDVGTGKTMVALFTTYLTHLNNYKTIYLAPTEILAKQHFETFKTYLEPLGVKILLKTGNSKNILVEEEFDVVIGTHAIFYEKETISRVGLIIIDEQHRFGVEQRSKLLNMYQDYTPNLLTMTATPIPRSLALTLYGDLTLSRLLVPPNKNKKITTRVVPKMKRLGVYNWIAQKNMQAFIVCPFIEQSESEQFLNVRAAEKEYTELKSSVFSAVEVGLLHGKMKSAEKEEIVEKFKAGELQVLISTPVIEVGIDVPEATVMVIESAERYGLASLHQLRGRVGRGDKEGFCFVIPSVTSGAAITRLKHLETVTSGIQLSEIDMQIRGQGDLYGTKQSGFKTFRVADLGDLELMEKTKQAAQKYFLKITNYPELEKRINTMNNLDILNN